MLSTARDISYGVERPGSNSKNDTMYGDVLVPGGRDDVPGKGIEGRTKGERRRRNHVIWFIVICLNIVMIIIIKLGVTL